MTDEQMAGIRQRIRQMRERLSNVITRPEDLEILLSTVQRPDVRQELQRIIAVIPETYDALLDLMVDIEHAGSDKE